MNHVLLVTGKKCIPIKFLIIQAAKSTMTNNMVKISKFYYKTKCIHSLDLFKKGEKKLINYSLKEKDNSLGKGIIHKTPK